MKPKTRKVHVTIHLSKRAKAALCARCEQLDLSAGTICRDAIKARFLNETGTPLPDDHYAKAGRRAMNAEQVSVCVIMSPEWVALIEAHAPGKARSWIAAAVSVHLGFSTGETKQRREKVTIGVEKPTAFIDACKAESHWPAGRVLMRGRITGRAYIGHAA